jgi:hypothetical protein
LSPGDIVPDSVIFVSQGHPIGVLLDMALEIGQKGFVAHGLFWMMGAFIPVA